MWHVSGCAVTQKISDILSYRHPVDPADFDPDNGSQVTELQCTVVQFCTGWFKLTAYFIICSCKCPGKKILCIPPQQILLFCIVFGRFPKISMPHILRIYRRLQATNMLLFVVDYVHIQYSITLPPGAVELNAYAWVYFFQISSIDTNIPFCVNSFLKTFLSFAKTFGTYREVVKLSGINNIHPWLLHHLVLLLSVDCVDQLTFLLLDF